jgi:hypothetical protein
LRASSKMYHCLRNKKILVQVVAEIWLKMEGYIRSAPEISLGLTVCPLPGLNYLSLRSTSSLLSEGAQVFTLPRTALSKPAGRSIRPHHSSFLSPRKATSRARKNNNLPFFLIVSSSGLCNDHSVTLTTSRSLEMSKSSVQTPQTIKAPNAAIPAQSSQPRPSAWSKGPPAVTNSTNTATPAVAPPSATARSQSPSNGTGPRATHSRKPSTLGPGQPLPKDSVTMPKNIPTGKRECPAPLFKCVAAHTPRSYSSLLSSHSSPQLRFHKRW